MSAKVHILATVRRPELMPAALLVFQTLRVGFPKNPVEVWGNRLDLAAQKVLFAQSGLVGAQFNNLPTGIVHDEWVEWLILNTNEPFWLCDTDVVFWQSIEDLIHSDCAPIMGRFEPAFHDEITGTVHVERLHTAVMLIDPSAARGAMRQWLAKHPCGPFSPATGFVRQHYVPQRERTLFYDTCAGLWQAGIGKPFPDELDGAFTHLHCATYPEAAAKTESMKGLPDAHKAVYADYRNARQLTAVQKQWYEKRKVSI